MAAPVLLVDARAAFASGLGRYLRETLRELAALGAFSELVLAGNPVELEPVVAGLAGSVRVVPNWRGRYAPDLPFRWAEIAAQVGGPHRTWFPHWDGAWEADGPVTTLHDLIALQASGATGWARRTLAAAWMRRMIAASRALITGSEGSAREIVKAFPEAAERLRVIPHGVAEVFFATPRGGAARAAPYLLAVANKKPHKNLEMAIRVFAECARDDSALRLQLVGQRFRHADALLALARSLGVGDRVDDVSGLSDAGLAQRYAAAEALLVTSRTEGFGMVALEGMAAGVPVVAVDRAPLPEVVGDAAALVPMDDVAAMAAAVRRLRSDAAYRAERVVAGRARASGFTWRRTAERTAEVLLAG